MTAAQATANCILIVEDDADVRESLTEILQEEGYRVASAANGREALDLLHSAGPPCLILLDLMMPVMSGWEFRERQRQDPALAQIPVAIVTGVRNGSARLAAMGAVAYLQKPIDIGALLATVSHHC